MKRMLLALVFVMVAVVGAMAVGISSGRGTYAQRQTCRANRLHKVYAVSDCHTLSCARGGGTVECDQLCVQTGSDPDTFAWRSLVCADADGAVTVNPTSTTSTTSTSTTTTTL